MSAAVETEIEVVPAATFEEWQAYLNVRHKKEAPRIGINYSFDHEGESVCLYGLKLQAVNDNTWFIADVRVGSHFYQVKILTDGTCRLTNRRDGRFAGGRSRGTVPLATR